jgi:hypothetical protein
MKSRPSRGRRPRERRRGIAALGAACVASLVAFAVTGCPGELENPERFGPAVCPAPMDVPAVIFARSCTDQLCHGDLDPVASLDLKSPDVLARLVDVPSSQCNGWLRIDSADPDESLLLNKLENAFPECGDHMPLGGKLTRVELACIRDWVFTVVGKGDGGLADGAAPDADEAASDSAGVSEASE